MTYPAEHLKTLLGLQDRPRPAHIEPVELEHTIAALLALTGEVSVLIERINRLEHQLADARGISVESLRENELGDVVEAENAAAREALLARVLHTVVSDYQAASEGSQGPAAGP